MSMCAAPLYGQRPDSDSTIAFPPPIGYVNDFARVLSDTAIAQLTSLSEQVREHSGGEIAVVTVDSLWGRPVRQVARGLGRAWGVGAAGDPDDPVTNTGVILLIAPGDRQVALELGTGTSRFVADSTAANILASIVIPALRDHRWDDAALGGIRAVADAFAARFGFSLSRP